jgi:hypothetical protein
MPASGRSMRPPKFRVGVLLVPLRALRGALTEATAVTVTVTVLPALGPRFPYY